MGFKAFILCGSKTGYAINHKILKWKRIIIIQVQKFMLRLVNELENQNYHIFMDNFYNSLPLLEDFFVKNIT